MDGSTEESEVFRLGNLNQVVKAAKRGYGSVTVAPSSNVSFSCMPVGDLSDGMYTEPDSLGGTRYCLPEGTLLFVSVADVSAGPDEWCTRAPLTLRERVGGGTTSHASMRALIHPTGSRVSGGVCCCDDEDPLCFCGLLSSTPRRHIFDGGPGGVMFTSLQVLDMYSDDLYFQGGSVTLCADLPGMDPTLPQKVYFEMKAYTGYQHLYTLVYNEDGELVATVYPAQGLRETTWIETSCAGGRLRGVAETVQQPTLEVDIEVEGNLVPPAVAGHFTFPKPDGCAGARKNYTYAIDNPDPEPDTPTELIAVTAVPQEGFEFVRWKGTGPVFDASGNYAGNLSDSLDDDPTTWFTEPTIYVKCLDEEAVQAASALTDMSIMAGATTQGSISANLVAASRSIVGVTRRRKNALVVEGGFTGGTSVAQEHLPHIGSKYYAMTLKSFFSREEPEKTVVSSELLVPAKPQDIVNHISMMRYKVFEYNGHGNSEALFPAYPVDNWYEYPPECRPLDSIGYVYAAITRSTIRDAIGDDSNYKFVFLNSCNAGMSGSTWQTMVFRAECLICWDYGVTNEKAQTFDALLWADLYAQSNPDEGEVKQANVWEAYDRVYDAMHLPPSGLNHPCFLGSQTTDLFAD